MKIIVPVNENNTNSDISQSFGRAPFFLVYEKEKDMYEVVKNPNLENTGGAGISTAQFLGDLGCNILICERIGENAAEVLKGFDIELYKSIIGDGITNINHFINGRLEKLLDIHKGFHNHGGNN